MASVKLVLETKPVVLHAPMFVNVSTTVARVLELELLVVTLWARVVCACVDRISVFTPASVTPCCTTIAHHHFDLVAAV